ncbi:zinc transporter ZntB [Abyssibius alkaniclasticus]|mgnify:CR=1 FL=1|uniref:zinc transporter ZntB n=1 Tax=Abyssibius alkaniclasticus TaxID=2881234 RepID=UPI00405882F7
MRRKGGPVVQDALALRLDGAGNAAPITLATAMKRASDAPGFTWLHLHRDEVETRARLRKCGLDHFICDALMADETRPRCTVHGDGVILNLRGVNLNPGAEPEDMVSVRLWVEAGRVIGVWLRKLSAVDDLGEAIARGQAPSTPGGFVAALALRLAARAEPTIAALNEGIDGLEELVLQDSADVPRSQLSALRRSAILLRRYMLPQRDALTALEIEPLAWLGEQDRSHLREAAERIYRLGEDLDAIRDRAQVVHDQVMDARAEAMNHQMLVLSVVAAVFLPLGLIAGLMGMNVGGIPLSATKWGFGIVLLGMGGLTAVLIWWFRKIGLFR